MSVVVALPTCCCNRKASTTSGGGALLLLIVCCLLSMVTWVHFESSTSMSSSYYTYFDEHFTLPFMTNTSIGSSQKSNTTTLPSHTQYHNNVQPSSSTSNNEEKHLIVDIMSIASQNRLDRLQAQKETFGAHKSIRHFFNVTELDDAWPTCAQDMTLEQAKQYIQTCRTKHAKGFVQQYRFFNQRWILNKANPIGWLCAQVRPGSAIGKLGRYYAQNPQQLPDFLLMIDDDTTIQMDLFTNEFQTVDPSIPKVWAGCLSVLPILKYTRYSPFGGSGTVWSRGALERLLQPVHCPPVSATSTIPVPQSSLKKQQEQICDRIQQNLLPDEKTMLVELNATTTPVPMYKWIEQLFHKYPNCFHSDWLLGHFVEYYYLSELWPDPRNRQGTARLHPLLQQESLEYFHAKDTQPGRLCKNPQVAKQVLNETCSKDIMVCHYMTPTLMRQVHEQIYG